MEHTIELHPVYVIDENGNKQSVILPIDKSLELLADLDDLSAIAERREEPTISHRAFTLRSHGKYFILTLYG